MRKKVKNRIVILGLITLLIFLFFLFQEKITYLISQKEINYPFKKFNKSEINKIVIENKNKTTEIYKKNDSWYLKQQQKELRANKEKVEKIIDALTEIKKTEIVSKNKNKHQDFGIDKNKVIFFNKKEKIIVYVGNSIDLNTNYIRLDNEDDVFLAENFGDVLTTDDWRDLNINLIKNQENIQKIELSFDEKKLILKKEKDYWQINQKKAKKDRVDFFINDLTTLKANDIVFSPSLSDINPSIMIIIQEKNQIKKAEFFEKDKDNYLLKTSFNDVIYQISSPSVSFLKKEESDFIQ